MPVPTDGLIEFTITQVLDGGELENVYYYHDALDAPLVSLAGVTAAFDALIMPTLADIQSNQLAYTNIRCRDVLGINPDLNITPSIALGNRTSDPMPNFYSMGFTLNAKTKETRSGAKRYGGQAENDFNGNSPTAAYLLILEAHATVLSFSIVTSTTFGAVVFGRVTPLRPVIVVNTITAAAVNANVTTQRTRII